LDPNITCIEFQTTFPPKKKEDQRVLDVEALKALEFVPEMKQCLAARFSLRLGMRPHGVSFLGSVNIIHPTAKFSAYRQVNIQIMQI